MTTTPGVQFVEKTTNLKFALTSVANATSHHQDLHCRLQVPAHYGWGSVAIGDQMQGAQYFIVYPNSAGNGATLSIRTASDEVEPVLLSGIDCKQQSMITSNGVVDAAFVCYRVGDDPRLTTDPSSSKWIWAVGPGGAHSTGTDRDSDNVYLAMHNYYGSFSLDMTKAMVAAPLPSHTVSIAPGHSATHLPSVAASAAVSLVPMITGSVSSGASSSVVASMPNAGLVHAHAILLGGAFLLLFPLGVFLLKLHSVRAHWITQAISTLSCIIGFAIAIAMSTMTEEYRKCNLSHQILGIVVVLLLIPQFALGSAHHVKFKKTGWGTWMAVPHLNLGRIILLLGMVAGITGFKLSDNTTGAVLYGLASGVMIVAIIGFIVWDRRRRAYLSQNHAEERPVEKFTPRVDPYRPEMTTSEVSRPQPIRKIYQGRDGRWQY